MNTVSTQRRKYELKARGESRERTRQRIIEATSELHGEVGPVRTTVAEIARRAGVQRLTVYTHFPTDAQLIAACGAHWQARHAPPDPSPFLLIDEPDESLKATLLAFYGWYKDNERIIANMRRDRLILPAVDEALRDSWDRDLSMLATRLAAGFEPPRKARRLVRAAVALALDFWTWRRLADEGLGVDTAAGLMVVSVSSVVTCH